MQTEFYETTIMPTYLLSLTISDFTCINQKVASKYSNSLIVGICGIPDRTNQFKLALNISKNSIEFLENHLQTGINLSKIGRATQKWSCGIDKLN